MKQKLSALFLTAALAVPASAAVTVSVNAGGTYPMTVSTQTITDAQSNDRRNLQADRVLAQSFTATSDFQLASIFITYHSGVANDAFSFDLISVANVNATGNAITGISLIGGPRSLNAPSNVTTTDPASAGAAGFPLEFAFSGDAVNLTNGQGYAVVFAAEGNNLSFKWKYDSADGNLYSGGRFFDSTGTGGALDDAVLAITAVPEPSSALLACLGALALLRRRRA